MISVVPPFRKPPLALVNGTGFPTDVNYMFSARQYDDDDERGRNAKGSLYLAPPAAGCVRGRAFDSPVGGWRKAGGFPNLQPKVASGRAYEAHENKETSYVTRRSVDEFRVFITASRPRPQVVGSRAREEMQMQMTGPGPMELNGSISGRCMRFVLATARQEEGWVSPPAIIRSRDDVRLP
ncbi:hypothetical protein ZHAS_00010783 [Anopheles sinensis]|uniref:Uncharacterized protein n=1 Tax=Anopheles sinensis TaxID=74873 RepID=A0A084VYQ5_ANOSI|nr:hypothetical protein ZHAS_00010783 [Anopheles sinensis]